MSSFVQSLFAENTNNIMVNSLHCSIFHVCVPSGLPEDIWYTQKQDAGLDGFLV